MTPEYQVTRREFLSSAAALIVYVTIPTACRAASAGPPRMSPSLTRNPELDAWLRLDADGILTVYSGKCELGQGIGTALAQIVADELDIVIGRIRMAAVDTERSPEESYTFSSVSVQHSGSALRLASAEARHLLLQNAARRLDVRESRLAADDGRIQLDGKDTSLTYWQLLSDKGFDTRVSGAVRPKSPDKYRYVGKSVERLDLPGKVFGEPVFIQDLRLPGMLHARIVRPRTHHVRLVEVNTGPVRRLPGVVTVVRDASFLAVVAEHEDQAIAAAEALHTAATWETPVERPQQSDFPDVLRRLRADETVIHETKHDSSEVVRELAANYSRPYTAHGSISPSAAVALWDGTTLTVWSHGQGMYPLRGAVAKVVGLPESKVRLVNREAAGCFGHNGADDAACDAAIVAMHCKGKAVRLQWSRNDEFRWEPFGSAMSMRAAAGLDAAGRILRWQYDVWSCTHSSRPAGEAGAGNLLAGREKTEPLAEPAARSIPQPAGGGDRNALPLYAFPQQRIVKHFIRERPLRVSALRGLGAYGNVFAIESFIDELALEAKANPTEFRLRHLTDPRAREVLQATHAAIEAPPPKNPGRFFGRGLGFARFKNLGAYVAVAMEVTVERSSGVIRLHRAIATVDAGQIINPDGLRNQIEGGIIQSASWTLKESVKHSASSIESVDWATYPILRFDEIPPIEIRLLDRPELPSLGVGEAAQGPTAAAIANAVANATGVRLRDLPLTPERVSNALRRAASGHSKGPIRNLGPGAA